MNEAMTMNAILNTGPGATVASAEPMAMSAPSAPGGVASTQASKSVATTTIAPTS